MISTLRILKRKSDKILNGLGRRKKCYVCGKTFFNFTRFRGGKLKDRNDFRLQLNGVGSDINNFGCMYCGSSDRERHLFMFFDKLMLWDNMVHKKILHFAPEVHLAEKITQLMPSEYIKADLYPVNQDIRKIDATAIPFNNNTFDFLIANHILEHIPDYRRALNEFYRIIKPGGGAILQTPYSKLLRNNFEDEGIDTDALRLFFHGQEDHVRTFGEYQFFRSIEEAGFNLQIRKHEECFDAATAYYYGVPVKEDLIMVIK